MLLRRKVNPTLERLKYRFNSAENEMRRFTVQLALDFDWKLSLWTDENIDRVLIRPF